GQADPLHAVRAVPNLDERVDHAGPPVAQGHHAVGATALRAGGTQCGRLQRRDQVDAGPADPGPGRSVTDGTRHRGRLDQIDREVGRLPADDVGLAPLRDVYLVLRE